jgi:hypothetical protein
MNEKKCKLSPVLQNHERIMNSHPRRIRSLILVCLLLRDMLLFAAAAPVAALGAGCEQQYHTSFATITYNNEDDLFHFTRSIGTGLSLLSAEPRKNPRLTAKRVDALIVRVMAILDMRMPGLRFSIRIHRDNSEIQRTYAMFTIGRGTPVAYYDHAKRAIFVSADTVNDRILAHEIAHAVICAWAPSPLPASAQEVLANYVEEHLTE